MILLGQDKQVRVDEKVVNTDPQLLFQKLLAIANDRTDEHDLDHFLQYKLCVHPAALFNESVMMREATKSQLADAIAQICPSLEYANTEPAFTVFHGGSLLHRI